MTGSLSFRQCLERTPLTAVQWRLWVLAAVGILLDGFDFFIVGVALPLVAVRFNLSPAVQGFVAVAAVAGAFVGALAFGRLSDRFGRRAIFAIDLVLFVGGAAASGAAWNAASLIAFRFILGVGIGGEYPLGVSYISESVPARLRAPLVVGAFAFQAIGSLLGVLVGIAVLSWYPSPEAWRPMLVAGVLPALIVVVLRQGLPESVPWLLGHRRYEEASLCASELLQQPVQLSSENCVEPPHVPNTNIFKLPLLRNLMFASIPWFLQDISTYGIGIFTPTVIAALAPGALAGTWLSRDLAATKGAAWVDVMLIAGFVCAIFAVQRMSRVRLQIAGFFGMALGLIVVASASHLPGNSTIYVFAGFMTFNLLMNAGPNSTTYLLSGESFPAWLRGTGSGIAAASAKLGAVAGAFFFPILRAQIGTDALLVLLACASIAGAAVTYVLRIDTSSSSIDRTGTKSDIVAERTNPSVSMRS